MNRESEFVFESDRLHQRPDGMKTVRTTIEHPENEIYFRRSPNTQAGRVHSQIHWAALIPASFDFVFFETVPERPGIQPQQSRGPLLDPLTPFERFQKQAFSIELMSRFQIQAVLGQIRPGRPADCSPACGASPRISASVTDDPVVKATTRSTTFSNSRTLPRHSCANSTRMASWLIVGTGLPLSFENFSRKC